MLLMFFMFLNIFYFDEKLTNPYNKLNFRTKTFETKICDLTVAVSLFEDPKLFNKK